MLFYLTTHKGVTYVAWVGKGNRKGECHAVR